MSKYNIIKIPEVDSTNNHALSLRKREVFKEGLVITSSFQTKGQGERGQKWESQRKKNLILSLVVEPEISIDKQFNINKLVSLSVMDSLLSLGVEPKIKWPNDVLVNKRKMAGILIQNIVSNDIITHSVIGIGLNVNQLIFNDYKIKATSLELELDKHFVLEDIQNILLNSIKNRLRGYREGLDTDVEYLNALFQKDKVSFFKSRSQSFNGVIRGVTDRGLLVVETDNSIKNFDLKEIRMLF